MYAAVNISLLSVAFAALGVLAVALVRVERKIDGRFDGVGTRMDAGFDRMDAGFDRIDERYVVSKPCFSIRTAEHRPHNSSSDRRERRRRCIVVGWTSQ